jgi:hypothetical protein
MKTSTFFGVAFCVIGGFFLASPHGEFIREFTSENLSLPQVKVSTPVSVNAPTAKPAASTQSSQQDFGCTPQDKLCWHPNGATAQVKYQKDAKGSYALTVRKHYETSLTFADFLGERDHVTITVTFQGDGHTDHSLIEKDKGVSTNHRTFYDVVVTYDVKKLPDERLSVAASVVNEQGGIAYTNLMFVKKGKTPIVLPYQPGDYDGVLKVGEKNLAFELRGQTQKHLGSYTVDKTTSTSLSLKSMYEGKTQMYIEEMERQGWKVVETQSAEPVQKNGVPTVH